MLLRASITRPFDGRDWSGRGFRYRGSWMCLARHVAGAYNAFPAGKQQFSLPPTPTRRGMSTPLDHRFGQAEAGLLLVGHGSRAIEGVDEFLATARLAVGQPDAWAVEPCFLEFAQPSIAEGFARLVRRGVRRVVVAPVILFAAGHIRRDIPRAVAAVAARHPHLAVEQAQHLGCHDAIAELSSQRYFEALAGQPCVGADKTILVIVGRGSRDAEATEEMLCFASMRQRRTPLARVQPAFLSMADPTLEQVLQDVARTASRRVVVQPHLLFAGELLGRIEAIVARFARDYPQTQWLVARHLGPSELVVNAVLDRARSALAPSVQPQ